MFAFEVPDHSPPSAVPLLDYAEVKLQEKYSSSYGRRGVRSEITRY